MNKEQKEVNNGDHSNSNVNTRNSTLNDYSTSSKQGNGIIRKSTLKQVAKFRKLLMFKRNEPHLESVLGNYSSDEDDE